MKRLFGIVVCALFCFCCSAEIVQIKKIDECMQYVQPDTLLIFDLDNTVMETAQTFGGDQWLAYQIQQAKNQGFVGDEAFLPIFAEWVTVQHRTNVQAVEPTTAALIEQLQKSGYTVLALTTRGLETAACTIDQLSSIGVDFSRSAPAEQELQFEPVRAALYRKGILFSSGTNKAALLFRFLGLINSHPQKILIVDDKEGHVKDLEKSCQANGVSFTGLRYGFLDEKINNFSPTLADRERELFFGRLVSDEEAKN